MAERRMFAKTIINSARFLKMPSETQALYFHLGLNADDDGIVEAFSICRSIGASEDNLKILVAKGFINVLNDDLVTHIMDWNEHNKIRPDRKIDSIYKDLLLQFNPDIELIEKRPRTDKKNLGTDNGRTMDGIGKDRIGEVSIGKDNIKDKLLSNFLKENSGLKKYDDFVEDFIAYRKQIKKALKTIAPIKLYINSLIELENLGYSFEYCIEQMKANEWQTVKKEYIHKQTKPQQKTRAESNREFIEKHYGINEDGNIIDTEIM